MDSSKLLLSAAQSAKEIVEICPEIYGDLAFNSSLQLLVSDEMRAEQEKAQQKPVLVAPPSFSRRDN